MQDKQIEEMKYASIQRGMKKAAWVESRLAKGDALEFALHLNGTVFFMGAPSSAYSDFYRPVMDCLDQERVIGILKADVRILNRDLFSRGYDFTLSEEDVYDLLELCGFYQDMDPAHFHKVRCKWVRWRGEACRWEQCKKGCRDE